MKNLFTLHEMNLITCIIAADIIGSGRLLELMDIMPESEIRKTAAKERLKTLVDIRDKLNEIIVSGPLEETVRFQFLRTERKKASEKKKEVNNYKK